LSLFGLLVTCCGHWISLAIAKHDAAERKADKERFEELDSRLKKSDGERERLSIEIESERLSTNRKLEEVRRGLYNSP